VGMDALREGLARHPRAQLGHSPTPLEPMARLTEALGGPPLFIKRDDCTGLATGGNKTRKLEYLCGRALAEGADWLISFGALQSNHARQTAAAAAKLGLGCDLILVDRVPHPEPAYVSSGNLLLDDLLGARVHCVADEAEAATRLRLLLDELEESGHRPSVIPTGGSNGVGALGYADCAAELLAQCAQSGQSIQSVVAATASAGTHAGLLAGLRAADSPIRVRGVNVYDADSVRLGDTVASLAGEATRLLGVGEVTRDDVDIVDGFMGDAYGVPTPEMREAVRLVARAEGILLDPVYTGKAMAGLISLVRSGAFSGDEAVVFLHTGGVPGLFAYGATLRE